MKGVYKNNVPTQYKLLHTTNNATRQTLAYDGCDIEKLWTDYLLKFVKRNAGLSQDL